MSPCTAVQVYCCSGVLLGFIECIPVGFTHVCIPLYVHGVWVYTCYLMSVHVYLNVYIIYTC